MEAPALDGPLAGTYLVVDYPMPKRVAINMWSMDLLPDLWWKHPEWRRLKRACLIYERIMPEEALGVFLATYRFIGYKEAKAWKR